MPKYHLATYGCQMNEFDSEVIAAVLEDLGYTSTPQINQADLIIFNTCAVRENADLKVYGRISQLKALKDSNPNLGLIVCGCLPQKDGQAFQKRFPYVDLVIGTHSLANLKQILLHWLKERKPLSALNGKSSNFNLKVKRTSPFSAWLPVSAGCDCACSFCIVPYVRGTLHSRPLDEIAAEAEELAAQGYLEITLLGQNVNRYGYDLRPRRSFAELLQALNKITGLRRIRYTSPHPKNFSAELIEALTLPKMCRHIHLPLQAGDNEVLKRMRRGYTREDFLNLVLKLREKLPDLSITTDIIVGFPGETEPHFQNTLALVQEVQFDNAFMFAYSPRFPTPAALLPEQVPQEEKMQRLYRLIELQNKISEQKNQALSGKTFEVLVEGLSKKDRAKLTGRTNNNKIVVWQGNPETIGKIIEVKITQGHLWGLEGEV
jgi:tRNA-2-methylthio-N6-dimethylallyladenosine synthase